MTTELASVRSRESTIILFCHTKTITLLKLFPRQNANMERNHCFNNYILHVDLTRLTAKGFWGTNPLASWGPSVWSLHVLLVPAWVFSMYSGFLPQSKDMQVRLIGNYKLPVGVNVSVSGCLSLYVGPVTDWRPVQGVPRCSPNASWDWLQHPCDPVKRVSGIDNGWMDGC